MGKLTRDQLNSIGVTVNFYFYLRIILYLLKGGYVGYLIIGILNLIGYAIFQVLLILYVYAKLKLYITKKNQIYFFVFVILGLQFILYLTMEDYQKIFGINTGIFYSYPTDKSFLERIIHTVMEFYNLVSFSISFAFFMIWDYQKRIFPFKEENIIKAILT